MSSVILCETNDERDPMACNMETDLKYSIGGVDATDVKSIEMPWLLILGKEHVCPHDYTDWSKIYNQG